MNFTGKPIPLPLDAGINRCLAHGHQAGEWCDRREHCAAHLTIRHDARINAPAAFRKCLTDNMAAYLPIKGFPVEEDTEIVNTVGIAFGIDPATLEPCRAQGNPE